MSTKTKNNFLVHPITGEPQLCFPSGAYLYCNFTKKDGKVYRYSKTKDFLKFFCKSRRRRNDSEDLIKKKNEPLLQVARSSN
ncbi:MAG: hypothetical protein NVSMB66_6530 [Candidatus Doudnabacteria bacterium]